MSKVILEVKKLCKSFSNGGLQQHVLKNMDLQIFEGDFTVIMGRSGSGKSTLLYALSGMDAPTSGQILLDNLDITGKSPDELAQIRRQHCGFVFQSMYLLDSMNVIDNILTGGLLVNHNKEEVLHKAKSILTRMKLNEQDMIKFPNQLSGGEKQRVAIARALINDPQILFADEPTGALNSAASDQVLQTFEDIHHNGQSIVTVTHDIKTAMKGNRILYVTDGIIGGDLRLEHQENESEADRRSKLLQFLGEMGW